jgi:FecR protein
MRRIHFTPILVFLLVYGLFCVESQAQRSSIKLSKLKAKVVEFKGTVEVGSSENKLTQIKDGKKPKLSEGDWIKCGSSSEARVDFGYGRIAVVSANSIVQLEQLAKYRKGGKGVSTKLFLKGGEVYSAIKSLKKKDDKYEVRTPTATAAVRGTRFVVRYNDRPPRKGETSVKVLEGVVDVIDKMGKKFEIDDEKQMQIDSLGQGEGASSMGSGEVQQLNESFVALEMAESTAAGPDVATEVADAAKDVAEIIQAIDETVASDDVRGQSRINLNDDDDDRF